MKKINIVLFLALILLAVLSIFYGEDTSAFIIMKLRIPRIMAGLLAGVAFGVAGNIFQTLLRNPLASPDIIGVSSGSTAAAVFSIMFLHLSRGLTSVIAVIAGVSTAALIYRIAYTNRYSTNRLILVGIGIQAVFTALINWMVMAGAEYDVPTAMRWMGGNLNGITTEGLPLLAIVVIVSVAILLACRHGLLVLTLGEEIATVLGVSVNAMRSCLMIVSVVMIAFATAITGPISSIAFLSGPIAARINGRGSANILTSGMVGAILVLGGDFIGQQLLFTRYPVGVITGILGAPYLIYLLIRQNKGGTF
ncbi:MAG: iron chelate uptake ABC transporter family permease subunit [Pseudobutyrivibrio sp.]|nr:iron chelate uptake ABC transporter family permease subunit [Pseudobutyrivibrio sp.]